MPAAMYSLMRLPLAFGISIKRLTTSIRLKLEKSPEDLANFNMNRILGLNQNGPYYSNTIKN
tara:strand:+ start:530 stop:715 length:186 start_codon:yes stop_codon:yes gene_type:complete